MKKFYPAAGKTAIVRETNKEQTYGNLVYNEKENVDFCKGKVVSIGMPETTKTGAMIAPDHIVGDWVVYRRKAAEVFEEYDIVPNEHIVAIVDESTRLTL